MMASYCLDFSVILDTNMPNTCIIGGHVKGKGGSVSMHRFPADETKRQQWLRVVGLTDDDITVNSRICSQHFLFGDISIPPSVDIGRRFYSPKKVDQDRGKRALKRHLSLPVPPSKQFKFKTPPSSRASSISINASTDDDQRSLSASIGEPLTSDFGVHELPEYDGGRDVLVAVADLGGVRGVQMHPPLAASNVFLMHCSNNNQAQFIH